MIDRELIPTRYTASNQNSAIPTRRPRRPARRREGASDAGRRGASDACSCVLTGYLGPGCNGAPKSGQPEGCLRSRHELVAVAVDREDVARFFVRERLDLLAQLYDEVVDAAVIGLHGLGSPHPIQDLVARDRRALALVQQLEQLRLVEGNRDRLAVAKQRLVAGIDADLADLERVLTVRGRAQAAAP